MWNLPTTLRAFGTGHNISSLRTRSFLPETRDREDTHRSGGGPKYRSPMVGPIWPPAATNSPRVMPGTPCASSMERARRDSNSRPSGS